MDFKQHIQTIEQLLGEPYGKVPSIDENEEVGFFKGLMNAARKAGRSEELGGSFYDCEKHSIHIELNSSMSEEEKNYHPLHELMHGYVYQRNNNLGKGAKMAFKGLFKLKSSEGNLMIEKAFVLQSIMEGIADYVAIKHLKTAYPESAFLKKRIEGLVNPLKSGNSMDVSEEQCFNMLMETMRVQCVSDGDLSVVPGLVYPLGYAYMRSVCDNKTAIGPTINSIIRSPPSTFDVLETSILKMYSG